MKSVLFVLIEMIRLCTSAGWADHTDGNPLTAASSTTVVIRVCITQSCMTHLTFVV